MVEDWLNPDNSGAAGSSKQDTDNKIAPQVQDKQNTGQCPCPGTSAQQKISKVDSYLYIYCLVSSHDVLCPRLQMISTCALDLALQATLEPAHGPRQLLQLDNNSSQLSTTTTLWLTSPAQLWQVRPHHLN